MAPRVSQRTRIERVLSGLRSAPSVAGKLTRLGAGERHRLAARLLRQRWTINNFYRTRTTITPAWTGDQLTTLFELSHYLYPRATWARRRATGESWYRREMMFTLLALVQHHFGREAAKAMRQLYREHGVKYRPRRQITAGQRAELAARSRFKKTEQVLDRALTTLATTMLAVRAAKTQVATVTGRRRITLDE